MHEAVRVFLARTLAAMPANDAREGKRPMDSSSALTSAQAKELLAAVTVAKKQGTANFEMHGWAVFAKERRLRAAPWPAR